MATGHFSGFLGSFLAAFWSSRQPRRTVTFQWMVAHRAIAVGTWLSYGGRPLDCFGCGHPQETQRHCLWDCPLAQQVWRRILRLHSYLGVGLFTRGVPLLGAPFQDPHLDTSRQQIALLFRLSEVTFFPFLFLTSALLYGLDRATLAGSSSVALHFGLSGGHAADASLRRGAFHQLRLFGTSGWSLFTRSVVSLTDSRETQTP